eukprot:7115777-Pyramimonas_sp.AAC.1
MRPKLGQGVDRLSPCNFKRLPGPALSELISIFESMESLLAWPVQTQLVIGHDAKAQGFRRTGHWHTHHVRSCMVHVS